MSFQYEKLPLLLSEDDTGYYQAWSRDSGDLVVVVIDDACYTVGEKSEEQLTFENVVLPLFHKESLTLSDVRAIGFLPLKKDETGAKQMLTSMQAWFNEITSSDTRVCFLVDVLYGPLVDALYGIDILYGFQEAFGDLHGNTEEFFRTAPRMIKELGGSCKYEKIQMPELLGGDDTGYYQVWSRNQGDLVIIVIDDHCHYCCRPSDTVKAQYGIFPKLREQALTLPDTRAIGFFPLAENREGADKVLKYIQNCLDGIITPDTRVYFLIDIMSGNPESEVAYQRTKSQLIQKGYPQDHIINLTMSGGVNETLDPMRDIVKVNEFLHIRDNEAFSEQLHSFLGLGLHKDPSIDDAIQFYAKPWQANWKKVGWDHDELETKYSDHLKALAVWLEDSITADDLYSWDDGESAKSLMIWLGSELWSDNLRSIQGEVLKAVLEKLNIPLSETCPIPDEIIPMPCTPCFPFLVSLRSFLLCCEEQTPMVSEIRFIQGDDKYIFRLMMKCRFRDHTQFENRFRETLCKYGKKTLDEHPFTSSLRFLIHCKVYGLPNNIGREYMRLFTDGTQEPIVEVKIDSNHIDLIWQC